MQKNEKKVVS